VNKTRAIIDLVCTSANFHSTTKSQIWFSNRASHPVGLLTINQKGTFEGVKRHLESLVSLMAVNRTAHNLWQMPVIEHVLNIKCRYHFRNSSYNHAGVIGDRKQYYTYWERRVSSGGMTLVPSSVKIHQLVQRLLVKTDKWVWWYYTPRTSLLVEEGKWSLSCPVLAACSQWPERYSAGSSAGHV
jgi:hypothetical protein